MNALAPCVLVLLLAVTAADKEARDNPPSEQATPAEAGVLTGGTDGVFGLSDASSRSASATGRAIGDASVFDQARRRPDCPLCDVSVYSYCGDRLLHDACCCLPPQQLPQQCDLADCSFLHAKSCHEHRLITRCCCDYRLF